MAVPPPAPVQSSAPGLGSLATNPNVLLALIALADKTTPDAQKMLALAKIGVSGAYAADLISKSNAGLLGNAASFAALGLNLANIANNSNLSNVQKVGASSKAAFDVGMSFVPFVGPIYAAANLASGIGKRLERSGSPEVRGAGRVLDYAGRPAGEQAFWNVATGMQSPAAAFKSAGGVQGALLDTMGPVGLIFRGLGKSLPGMPSPPSSEGGKFRTGVGRVFDRVGLPINVNFQDRSAYEAPEAPGVAQGRPESTAENWRARVGTEQLDAAQQFANQLADAMGRPADDPYRTQLLNIMLNNYQGPALTDAYAGFQKWMDEQRAAAAPQGATPGTPGADALATMIRDYMNKPKSFAAYVAS